MPPSARRRHTPASLLLRSKPGAGVLRCGSVRRGHLQAGASLRMVTVMEAFLTEPPPPPTAAVSVWLR